MLMNTQLWDSFDVGRAPVLRKRTVAWHVNKVMNSPYLGKGELLLNNMAQDNILRQEGEQWFITRITLARRRDIQRLPLVLGYCVQVLHREQAGSRGDSGLPTSWKNLDKLYKVQCALESIVVDN